MDYDGLVRFLSILLFDIYNKKHATAVVPHATCTGLVKDLLGDMMSKEFGVEDRLYWIKALRSVGRLKVELNDFSAEFRDYVATVGDNYVFDNTVVVGSAYINLVCATDFIKFSERLLGAWEARAGGGTGV